VNLPAWMASPAGTGVDLLDLALLVNLAGCLDLRRFRGSGPCRHRCLWWAGLSALLLAAALLFTLPPPSSEGLAQPWTRIDRVSAIPLCVYTLGWLMTLLLLPARHSDANAGSGLLLMHAGMLLHYGHTEAIGMALGWWLAALPFLLGWFARPGTRERSAHSYVLAGTVAFSLAALVDALLPASTLAIAAMSVLTVLAVVLHKGIYPAHVLLTKACDMGSLLPIALFYNGHLGALLLLRHLNGDALPLADWVFPLLGGLALISSLYVSILGIAERRPRRLLAYVMSSQAAFVLSVIAAGDPAAGLLYWGLVVIASTGLVGSYVATESRCPTARDGVADLGLAVRTPRLAAMFLTCALALVGLPGTIGFWAEDVLVHATMNRSFMLPVALLLATALNALHLMRLYCMLYLGAPAARIPWFPDLLLRERIALGGCAFLLVAGGLWPKAVIDSWPVFSWSVQTVAARTAGQ